MDNSDDRIIELEYLKKNLKKEIKKINDEIGYIQDSQLTKDFLPLVSNDFKPLIKQVSYAITKNKNYNRDNHTIEIFNEENFVILFTNDMMIHICISASENYYNDLYDVHIDFNGDGCYDLTNHELIICNSSKKYLNEILKAYNIDTTIENNKKILNICEKLILFKSVILPTLRFSISHFCKAKMDIRNTSKITQT
jgi:hypothetical protein